MKSLPDDTIAVSFAAVLYRTGIRVSEDISMVGHNVLLIAAHNLVLFPTASQPFESIARQIVDLLMSCVEGYEQSSRIVELRGELDIHESTAPLKNIV
ncbi:MAG: substrate-binding domain-containing protein [Abditibacteriaceae bacterium]